jgi:hypothetical protein
VPAKSSTPSRTRSQKAGISLGKSTATRCCLRDDSRRAARFGR